MKRNIPIEAITCLFILLFTYTALNKLTENRVFKMDLGDSPLIVNGLAPILAIAIPLVEFSIVLFLLTPMLRKWGLYSSFVLMSIFTLYIGYFLIFSKHIPCACGGIFRHMGWGKHLIINIALTLIAFVGIRLDQLLSRQGSDPCKSNQKILC